MYHINSLRLTWADKLNIFQHHVAEQEYSFTQIISPWRLFVGLNSLTSDIQYISTLNKETASKSYDIAQDFLLGCSGVMEYQAFIFQRLVFIFIWIGWC